MTSINVIRHPNAVHMITDGSAENPDDTRFGLAKVFQIPHLNAVVAFRGWSHIVALMAIYIQTIATSYDELKAVAAQKLRASFSEGFPGFEMIVAGISESTGPDSYFVRSQGETPWEVLQLTDCAMLPADPPMLLDFRAQFPGIYSGTDLDPVQAGIAMIEIQRKHATDFLPGLFTQMTSVTATEITTRIIGRG